MRPQNSSSLFENRVAQINKAVLSIFILAISCPVWAKPSFPIKDQGSEFPVNFEKYGTFSGVGTSKYKYKITDRPGLAKAMGPGLFPNFAGIASDPAYSAWAKKKPKNLNPWDFTSSGNPQVDFYVWTEARELGMGVKLFFIADALEKAGHFKQALKAFHAVVVLFPDEPCWSADHSFVWYVGPASLSRIEAMTRHNPSIGYRLRGALCDVKNGNDTDLKNDEVTVDPGRWEKVDPKKNVDLKSLKIIQKRGYGKVHAVQYANKHWQLIVDGEPFVVRGMTYNPTTIGRHIAGAGLSQWMREDVNENGKIDTPYDTYVDANKNGQQDVNEPSVGDFKLMRDMGVNAIRMYHSGTGTEYDPDEINKEVLRDLYHTYGIRVIMGDLLGAYTIGSGALWEDGTDYTDPIQLENMRRQVKELVNDHKGESYVLMWLLGNENLMESDYTGINATRTKASRQVKEYVSFVNEIAEMIHRIDPEHPVAVGNIDLAGLADYGRFAPAVDIFGANSYRGSNGFGDLWKRVQNKFDRPILLTEFGCDAYDSKADKENEAAQALYHEGAWKDIELNLAGGPEEGNAIGGVVFEFLDEWWKSHQGGWDTHEGTKDSNMAFPDGWSSDEYYGVISQGEGTDSPFLRQLRKTYMVYKDKLWKK